MDALLIKEERDTKNRLVYCEWSDGFWIRHNFDDDTNTQRSESSKGYWFISRSDNNNREVYYEDSRGAKVGQLMP